MLAVDIANLIQIIAMSAWAGSGITMGLLMMTNPNWEWRVVLPCAFGGPLVVFAICWPSRRAA